MKREKNLRTTGTRSELVLRSKANLDRRNFVIKSAAVGTGAWLAVTGPASIGSVISNGPASLDTEPSQNPRDSFQLGDLPYDYQALEPIIDTQTMNLHHTKHHQAYVNGLNAVVADHSDLAGKTVEELLRGFGSLPESAQTAVRNHGGGHHNHTLFWQIMRPAQEKNAPAGRLAQVIDSTFGSFDRFKEIFSNNAMTQFGSGWSWLVVADGKLELMKSANQDSPLMEGKTPILGIDVWEHAYYLKYQNRRADYVQAWWDLVNWNQVAENMQNA